MFSNFEYRWFTLFFKMCSALPIMLDINSLKTFSFQALTYPVNLERATIMGNRFTRICLVCTSKQTIDSNGSLVRLLTSLNIGDIAIQ